MAAAVRGAGALPLGVFSSRLCAARVVFLRARRSNAGPLRRPPWCGHLPPPPQLGCSHACSSGQACGVVAPAGQAWPPPLLPDA
eukprot:12132156-Alexandrium_andersonii.AAC.1